VAQYFISGPVTIQHHFNRFLRCGVRDEQKLGGNGGKGRYARWELELHGDNIFKFKNLRNQQYLQIKNRNNKCCFGSEKESTLFIYDPINKTLQSTLDGTSGIYIAVMEESEEMKSSRKRLKILATHTVDSLLYFFNDFNILYLNQRYHPVIICNVDGGALRVKSEDQTQICCGADPAEEGSSFLWIIEWFDDESVVLMKSVETGGYLRMRRAGIFDVKGYGGNRCEFKYDATERTLESVQFPDSFIAIKKHDKSVISVSKSNDKFSTQFAMIEIESEDHEVKTPSID